MSTSSKRRLAEQFYRAGHALFERGLYREALSELRKAEDIFRKLDARGHPFFPAALANGLSGLADTLILSGKCCQMLGNYRAALTCYETSFINAKYEKKKAARAFAASRTEAMIACYEAVLKEMDSSERQRLLSRPTEVDIAFRFPYSLPSDIIPIARLYELAPERYPGYGDFYRSLRARDAAIRHRSRTTDESSMKKISVTVWSILLAIWVIYGFIAVKALININH